MLFPGKQTGKVQTEGHNFPEGCHQVEELVHQVEQIQSSSLKNGTSDPVWKETIPVLRTVFRGKLLIFAFLPSEISRWFGGLSHVSCFIICVVCFICFASDIFPLPSYL